MDDYCRIVVKPYWVLCTQHGIGLKDYNSLAHAAILRQAMSTSVKLLAETCPSVDLSQLRQQLAR